KLHNIKDLISVPTAGLSKLSHRHASGWVNVQLPHLAKYLPKSLHTFIIRSGPLQYNIAHLPFDDLAGSSSEEGGTKPANSLTGTFAIHPINIAETNSVTVDVDVTCTATDDSDTCTILSPFLDVASGIAHSPTSTTGVAIDAKSRNIVAQM